MLSLACTGYNPTRAAGTNAYGGGGGGATYNNPGTLIGAGSGAGGTSYLDTTQFSSSGSGSITAPSVVVQFTYIPIPASPGSRRRRRLLQRRARLQSRIQQARRF